MTDKPNDQVAGGQGPVDDQPAPQDTDDTPTPEMVSKDEFTKVLNESIKRKKEIQTLRSENTKLQKLQTTEEGTKVGLEERVKAYEAEIETLKSKNSRLAHIGTIRDKLSGMGVLDARVADLAYTDAERDNSLDPELLDGFLNEWKKANTTLFKPESTISTPAPQAAPKVHEPPAAMTPDAEWAKFQAMTPGEKQKLSQMEFERMMALGAKIAGDQLKQ